MKVMQGVKQTKTKIELLLLLLCSLFVVAVPVYAQSSTSVVLPVKQMLQITGSELSKEDSTFDYLLIGTDANTPMPDGSTSEEYRFSINGEKSLEVGPIYFENAGIYQYKLEQIIEKEELGYTYDKECYSITIYVKNSDSGGLTTEVIAVNTAGNKVENLQFKNAYQPQGTSSALMTDPPVKKIVSGNPSSTGTFEFKLTAEDPDNPMPEGSKNGVKSITIKGEGESEFGTWAYMQAGTYRYRVSEKNTGEKGYKYDATVYTITDIVTDEKGQLSLSRSVVDNSEKKTNTCIFRNVYSKGVLSSISKVMTGDNTNLILCFAGIVGAIVGIVFVLRKRNKLNQ